MRDGAENIRMKQRFFLAFVERSHPTEKHDFMRHARSAQQLLDFEIEADVCVRDRKFGRETMENIPNFRREHVIIMDHAKRLERRIPGKQFVAAVAAERDFDMLCGKS